MLRTCVRHRCRLYTKILSIACYQVEPVTQTSQRCTSSMHTVVVNVLQPVISLHADRRCSSAKASHDACWQCGRQLNSSSMFFCPECKTILPPGAAHADLFRVMGLPEPSYEINLRQLEGEYKRLQKDLHPDKFGSRGAQQQEFSAEQSSLVNRAYTVLRNPLQRALYLLEKKGMPAPEDGGTISDPELLMEIMDQREVIEETHDLVVLQAMLQENKLLQQATTERLSAAFKNNDLEEAQRVVTNLRYVTRAGEAIAQKIPGG